MTTNNANATANTIVQPNPIQRDAVVLYFSVGRLRTRRKLSPSMVQTDIAPDMLHLSKDILKSPELKAVEQFDNALRTWVKDRCVPSPFSKKGILWLPVRLITAVMEHIDAVLPQREELIDACINMLGTRKQEAIEQLGSGFNEADYPTEEEARASFYCKVQMWELNAPGQLKALSQELYRRELVKMDNMWAEASAKVTHVLLQEFRSMTAHLVERLTPDESGKTKIFRDSVVGNMLEWMDLFKARNLAKDAQLDEIVDRARELISGLDAESIRDSKGLRNQLATDFQGITERLDQAIIEAPIRAIDFDLDEAAV